MSSSRAHKMQKGQFASGGTVGRAMRTIRREYADGGDVVKDRAMFLPLGTYGDGTTRAAWPGLLYEPAAAWKRMVDRQYRPGDAENTRQMAEDSFTVAGAVPLAGLAAGAVRGRMPRATLSSNAGDDVSPPRFRKDWWNTPSGNPAVQDDFPGGRWIARGETQDMPAVYRQNSQSVDAAVDDMLIDVRPTMQTPGQDFSLRPDGKRLYANTTKASAPGLGALEANRVRTPERAAKLGVYLANRQTREAYKNHHPDNRPTTNRIFLNEDVDVPDAVMNYADEGKSPRKAPVENVPIDSLVPTQGLVDFSGDYALGHGFADNRPINVVRGPDGKHYVLDGHHRMMMRRLLRQREIPAKIEGEYDPVAEAIRRSTRK